MSGLTLPNDDLITTDGFPATSQATGAVYTVLVNPATGLPYVAGGGGGGGSLSDVLLIDNNGVLCVQRDDGLTLSYVRIDTGAVFTPAAPLRAPTQADTASINAKIPTPVGGAMPVTGPLTDAQLRANPVPISLSDPSTGTSFGPITSANTVLFAAIDTANYEMVMLQITGNWSGGISLQVSQNGTDWFNTNGISQNNEYQTVSTVLAPDVINIPVTGRFFRAITTLDFIGSVSGSYTQRDVNINPFYENTTLVDVDPQVVLAVAGLDPSGYRKQVAVSPLGGVVPADGVVFTGTRAGIQPGTVVMFDTTGYGSILLQLVGTWTGTVTFQVSNDTTTWVSAVAWPAASAAAPVNTATAVGQWVIPCAGKFFRVQITTAGTGLVGAVAVLKNMSSWMPLSSPSIAANSSVNVAQLAGTAPVTAGVAGTLAVGGNVAEDAAATSNPLICGGVARTALPASTVIAGDAIRQTFSVSGQMITKENAPGDLDFYANATVTTNTQTAIRAAQGASVRQNVTSITFQNTNATATTLTIQDGATTLTTFSVPASMTLPAQLNFPTPLRGTANTALNYTAGTTGANVLLTVTGFNSY